MCLCRKDCAAMVQPDVPKLGNTWEDRKGMCGPHEIHAARTVAWIHSSRATESPVGSVASWLSTVEKMCVRGKLRSPNGEETFGRWECAHLEVGWECTCLLPHTEGGSCHRSPEMLPQQLQPWPQLQWGSKLPGVQKVALGSPRTGGNTSCNSL